MTIGPTLARRFVDGVAPALKRLHASTNSRPPILNGSTEPPSAAAKIGNLTESPARYSYGPPHDSA